MSAINSRSIASAFRHAATADLLVACARANLHGHEFEIVQRLLQTCHFNWDAVLQTSLDHGVLPLVHRAIKRAGSSNVPAEFWEKLQNLSQKNALRNLLLLRELLNLIKTLREKDIHVLPYKGPLLALLAYGDASLRQCGDLDVLVPKSEIEAGRKTLAELGYLPTITLTPSEEAKYFTSPHEYDFAYVHPKTSVMIELHWRVAGRFLSFDPDPTRLWERSNTHSVFGTNVNVIVPEYMLLILCAHGTKHFWSRLTWICDIAQHIQANPSLDWKLVMRRADSLGARGMTLLGLALAKRVLDVPLPKFVQRAIRPAHRAQAEELALRLFDPAEAPDELPKGARMQLSGGGLFESLLFHFRTRENWTSGMRYCFHRAFTPNAVDEGWMQLPPSMHFMYYFVRPLRLLSRYGPLSVSKLDPRNGRSTA